MIVFFSSCNVNKHLKENEYLVEKNTVKTNGTSIDNDELEAFIRQKPNRKILKLVRFNLWLYNQINQEKMLLKKEKRNARYDRINQKRIAKAAEKNQKRAAKKKRAKTPKLKNKEKSTFRESLLEAGEPPVILDTVIGRITVNQMQRFVNSRGYFDSRVRDSVVIDKKNKRAKTFYMISHSKPYYIRNIDYKIEDPLIEYFIFNDTLASLVKRNSIYNEDVLQQERERISENQLNNGYFYFAPEYVYYLVDTNLIGQNINITIGIKKFSEAASETNDSLVYKPHPRFYIGNVFVISETLSDFRGKANDVYMKDTLNYSGLTFLYNKKPIFHQRDIARNISVANGQLYQKNLAEATFKDLSALKVFKNVYIQYLKNPYSADKLDCYIVCQPVVKQSITIEQEGTNTSGNLGIAGSIVFQNKNTFKGAELLEIKLKGSVTSQKPVKSTSNDANLNTVQSTFNTVQFGPELNLYFPRALFPFTLFYYKKAANEKRYFFQPKTILNLSLNYQSNQQYFRNISNISYGFKFSNYKGLFTYDVIPLETYIVKAKLFGSFKEDLISLNDYFLLNSFQDHLTTLSKVSATYNNQTLSKKRNMMYLRMNISSSGNILRGLFRATNQKTDSVGRYQILNIPFSQFVKLDVDYRFYFKVRKQSKLVYRFAGGIGKALDNLSVIPYEQSFFSGGPNGIRAWRARTLGPGGYAASESDARYDKIGDIQLESNLEYRFNIIKSIFGAWFIDAGNIWLLNGDPNKAESKFEPHKFYKEIAIGSGFGLRYDFSFFVLRLDAAVKIRDPQFAENNRWTFDKQPIRKMTILNFGIGYPF